MIRGGTPLLDPPSALGAVGRARRGRVAGMESKLLQVSPLELRSNWMFTPEKNKLMVGLIPPKMGPKPKMVENHPVFRDFPL